GRAIRRVFCRFPKHRGTSGPAPGAAARRARPRRPRPGRAGRCAAPSRARDGRRPRRHCAQSRRSRIPPRARPRPPPRPRAPKARAAEGVRGVLHRVDRSSAQPINGPAMSNKMWGGRFGAEPDAVMEEINASIGVDRALYAQDIAASKAHAEMLARQGILSHEDADKIAQGLDTIRTEIEGGKFSFQQALEDIHTHIEARLQELIGPAAGRLHAGRSRNDQVATDFKLWIREAIGGLDAALADYQHALAEKALEHAGTLMPGLTHLQTAQPVTFGHYLLAYVEMAGPAPAPPPP